MLQTSKVDRSITLSSRESTPLGLSSITFVGVPVLARASDKLSVSSSSAITTTSDFSVRKVNQTTALNYQPL